MLRARYSHLMLGQPGYPRRKRQAMMHWMGPLQCPPISSDCRQHASTLQLRSLRGLWPFRHRAANYELFLRWIATHIGVRQGCLVAENPQSGPSTRGLMITGDPLQYNTSGCNRSHSSLLLYVVCLMGFLSTVQDVLTGLQVFGSIFPRYVHVLDRGKSVRVLDDGETCYCTSMYNRRTAWTEE